MALSLLGATGSIGRQTLDVAAHLGLEVCSLAAGKRVRELEEAVRRFRPRLAVLYDEKAAADARVRLADTETKVLSGMGGLLEAASLPEADTVLAAMSGAVGLRPALRALEAGKKLALANKETLVCAGNLVTALAKEKGLPLLPVDSEHSAIFQCLQGGGEVRRILLTASGGPFRTLSREALKTVTREDALKHPNWAMGPKITVDSATLMNKGLEFIEAMWLFSLPPEKITVLVHPQSVVHSAVEFVDGAVIAQLGTPDMRLPIQLALTWPERKPSPAPALDLTKTAPLTFEEPDMQRFPCLALAMECAGHKGTADCAVMNAANEEAVGAFLRGQIGFTQIYDLVAAALERLSGLRGGSLEEIVAADDAARRQLKACLSSIS
ncbi:MAG: 1-deoxy-D-xylulose-5-phosphate reductoisomerase [Oscillospiraceae bacterium]|nr:1-deoxy-D-xylulose-5-phosphate reductoisomerase [Oscillospiraceae bacterium]